MSAENIAGSNFNISDDDFDSSESDDPDELDHAFISASRDITPGCGDEESLEWENYGRVEHEHQALHGKAARIIWILRTGLIRKNFPSVMFTWWRTLSKTHLNQQGHVPSWARTFMEGDQYLPRSGNTSITEPRVPHRLTTTPSVYNPADTSTPRPSFLNTLQKILVYSWVNLLLVFVPIGIVAYLTKAHPSMIFTSNAIAIIPLSGLLTYATESIASDMGDTVGALMNVSFGNIIELVILTALVNNQIRIVQASLLGSILVNLLLILGTAILVGGLEYQEQIYSRATAQVLACLLCLSVFSMLIPTAFHASFRNAATADQAVLKLSRCSSVVLLLIYLLYLLFQLKSHAHLTRPVPQRVEPISSILARLSYDDRTAANSIHASYSPSMRLTDTDPRVPTPIPRDEGVNSIELDTVDQQESSISRPVMSCSPQLNRSVSKGDGSRPGQGRRISRERSASIDKSLGRNSSPGLDPTNMEPATRAASHSYQSSPLLVNQGSDLPQQLRSPLPNAESRVSGLFNLPHRNSGLTARDCPDAIRIGRSASLVLVLASSLFVAICAEFLVNSIDDMVEHSPLSEAFIGLIILPIAGNMAEHITAMTVAARNKMDLAIGVSVGSSIQIALFVTPVVVIIGWILDRDMTLYFSLFETIALAATAFVVNFIILNGRTNYLEGALLCACYFIIGVGAYLYPGPEDQISQ